jgi:hypothetical protein
MSLPSKDARHGCAWLWIARAKGADRQQESMPALTVNRRSEKCFVIASIDNEMEL